MAVLLTFLTLTLAFTSKFEDIFVFCIPEPSAQKERRGSRASLPTGALQPAWRGRGLCTSHSAGCATALRFSAALIESRIGRMTNKASATTIRFMIDATTKTECQLPVCVFRMLASGTTKAETPLAEYIRAVLVVAYFGPNMSVVVEGNRLKISPQVKKTIAAKITKAHGVVPAVPSSQ